MFVHHGKLEHVLPASAYVCDSAFAAEQQQVFLKHWHIAGLAETVRQRGGFCAAEVLGVPVIVHHGEHGLVAYRNTCAHRHAMLQPNGHGTQAQLTCQYHGWQYSAEGRVCRVPDGQSFKGIKTDQLRLHPLKAEICGPFVLVCFDQNAGSFRQHLGEFSEEFDSVFGHHRHFATWQSTHAVNWKIIVENAVESYHVPLVHPTTFRNYRPSELHDHQLQPTYSRYADLQPWDQSVVSLGFRFLAGLLLKSPNFERFKHTHVYPNHLLYYGDLMSTWTVVEPAGPMQSRYTLYAFVPADVRLRSFGKLLQNLSSSILFRQFKKILGEDMDLWPKVQGGLRASNHAGVLSCREERIWAFQDYIRSCATALSDGSVKH